MLIRQYFTEFALNISFSYVQMLKQDALDDELVTAACIEYPCHIYMIGRRPKVTMRLSDIDISAQFIQGHFQVQHEDAYESYPFVLENRFKGRNLNIQCPYPYTRLYVANEDTQESFSASAGLLAQRIPELSTLLDLEIMYVGQAYGREGSRLAPERLMSHSTLQRIYSDIIDRTPDKEAWILLCSFEASHTMVFNPSGPHNTTDEEDDAHIDRVMNTEVTMSQQVTIAEAALIRYFEPAYNIEYRANFPDPTHRSYSEIYDLDYNAVAIVLGTEELGCRLWSPKVPPQWVHIFDFPLHSIDERVYMFDFFTSSE